MPRAIVLAWLVALLAVGVTGHVGRTHANADTISYAPGWRLVSGSANSALRGAAGSLYTLQPDDAGYRAVAADAPLVAGWGYWAYFPNGGALQPGAEWTAYSVTLTPGRWTLVGDPSAYLPATLRGGDAALALAPDGSYAPATTIAPGTAVWVAGSGTLLVTAGPPPWTGVPAPPIASLSVTSPAFTPYQALPSRYTCDGQDVSPALYWRGAPAATASFAVMVFDIDASGAALVQWAVFNLPATASSLPEAAGGVQQAVNDFGRAGYTGPCQPPGASHRFSFEVFALDTTLALSDGGDLSALSAAVLAHVVGWGEVVAVYPPAP